MAKFTNESGGFVARNRGEICDCYSNVSVTAGAKRAGFCGRNSGSIKRCYSAGRLRKYKDEPRYGFCAEQNGIIEDSFWICKENECKDFKDSESGIDQETFNKEYEEFIKSWDTENIWKASDSEADIRMKLCFLREDLKERKRVVEISDKQGLYDAVNEINTGAISEETMYVLTDDIDMAGSSWIPAGIDGNTPFEGCFDGNGHTIRNFNIPMKNVNYGGFFGYIGKKGEVHNLIIDCVITGKGNYAAPMCGWNEGLVTNCVTRTVSHGARYNGGFIAHNGGTIRRCSAYGKVRLPLLFPWWMPALCLSLLIAAVPAIMAIQHFMGNDSELFAPVIVDPNAKPIEKDDETIPEPDDKTDTSTAFIMNASMEVSTENYAGAIGLKCPPWSTKGYVATAVLSGSDLAKNGASYTEDVEIYKSGLIGPGMGVEVIVLPKLPDGSAVPKGNYSVVVQFDFYDMKTNECSAVNTTAPIEVTVY